MESNFNNNDFERFLKQNADQYRMFPSENVWDGIHSTLHTRRRWHGLWLALLLLTTGAVTWIMLTTPGNKKDSYIAARKSVSGKQAATDKPATPVTTLKPTHNTNKAPIASPGNQERNLFMAVSETTSPESYSAADPSVENASIAALAPVSTLLGNINTNYPVQASPARTPATVISRTPSRTPEQPNTVMPVLTETVPMNSIAGDLVADPAAAATPSDKTASASPEIKSNDLLYPLTIESVINSYSAVRKTRKAKWQVFITPTVTYRKLNENKQFINSARSNMSPSSLTYSPDLNNIVTHRPDLGLQLGISMSYPLSKKLALVTGLQFNISKYDIWAYNYPSEIATVALANDYGGTSTVSTVTNYRIVGVNRANKANWLRNFYYSASLPVGLEYKVFKTKRAAVGVAATFQPTYVLGNRAYVISTDYKNYMEVPSLTRKWNINAGFEAFAGFKVGKTSWRIGPQARYQTMSSFKKEYPVQEHLFDYGLKLGIQLNR
jgi:hypothetical protein